MINLAEKSKTKPKVNQSVAEAAGHCMRNLKVLNSLKASGGSTPSDLAAAHHDLATSRLEYRREVRTDVAENRDSEDIKLAEILSKNPTRVFSKFRAASASSAPVVNKMKVGEKVYTGEFVPDGIFDSLSQLKAPDMRLTKSACPAFSPRSLDTASSSQRCRCLFI